MMVVLFLTACGNEPTQELVQTDTQAQTDTVKPVADYSKISKTDVQTYVNKLSDAMQKTQTINTADITATHDWSKVIGDLTQEGLQYGENMFSEPYGRCATLGIDLQNYWQQVRSGDELKLANNTLNQFNNNKKACEEILQKLP